MVMNSMVMFTLTAFEGKSPFFYGKFVSKNQNCLLKLKLILEYVEFDGDFHFIFF